MAKLTNQEIKAVANKLHKLLEEKARLEKLRAIHEYIPSPTYQKFETLLKEFHDVVNQLQILREREDSILQELYTILNGLGIEGQRFHFYDKKKLEEFSNKIIAVESKIPEIPSIEDLKNEITIAGIDESFDVETYINTELAKFN